MDTPGRCRLLADRLSVGLDVSALDIDVTALQRLVAGGLAEAPVDSLEAIALRYRGPLLEGLDLPNVHDFHSWCLAEREGAMRAQSLLLAALVERLREQPERALPHAQALVRLSPYDEAARARLVGLLQALHRPREAEQQYRLGMRLLGEAGIPVSGALPGARRARPAPGGKVPPGEGSAAPFPSLPAAPPAPPPESNEAPSALLEGLTDLDPESLEVLRWAAVLAPRIEVASLGRYSGLSGGRLGAALEVAERRGLIVTGEGGPRFVDTEVAAAIHAAISPARRQMMHRRIADGLALAAVCDLDHAGARLAEARSLASRQRISHPALPMAQGLLAWHAGYRAEAESALKDARTLYKASGDRLGEFQANEALMMMAHEQGEAAQMLTRCQALWRLGERLRDGSEAPFAQAALGLCRLLLDDDPAPLAAALPGLRDADARHRLAWVLNRAALLHLERGRPAEAAPAAAEALTHALALERASEQLLAHGVLAAARQAQGELPNAERHALATAALLQGPVADWAHRRAEALVATAAATSGVECGP